MAAPLRPGGQPRNANALTTWTPVDQLTLHGRVLEVD
jgi:hypothetical protein